MKKLFLISLASLIISCSGNSDDDAPSYAGQYYAIKTTLKKDGSIYQELKYEGTCAGKSSFIIQPNKTVTSEQWTDDKGPCIVTDKKVHNFDYEKQTMDGIPVKFEGKMMIIGGQIANYEQLTYYRKN